jgi:hypothetical protein
MDTTDDNSRVLIMNAILDSEEIKKKAAREPIRSVDSGIIIPVGMSEEKKILEAAYQILGKEMIKSYSDNLFESHLAYRVETEKTPNYYGSLFTRNYIKEVLSIHLTIDSESRKESPRVIIGLEAVLRPLMFAFPAVGFMRSIFSYIQDYETRNIDGFPNTEGTGIILSDKSKGFYETGEKAINELRKISNFTVNLDFLRCVRSPIY